MIITRTPYRISLFGGGTDYPEWYKDHGGAVISATIDKYCYIAATPYNKIFPQRYKVYWKTVELVNKIRDIEHPVVREGLRMLGYTDSLKLYYHGDLPSQSGLGSSSSFTVGFLHAILALQSKQITKRELAQLAIKLERHILKEHGGEQDQLAAAHGGFNYFTFPHEEGVKALPSTGLEDKLMLFYVGRDEERFSSAYAKNWIDCIPHKTQEFEGIQRITSDALAILESSEPDIDEIGILLDESWYLKRALSETISDPQVDAIYAQAKLAGALGGKLLGAGGKGFMVFYVPEGKQEAVRQALSAYHHTPFRFEYEGTKLFRIS